MKNEHKLKEKVTALGHNRDKTENSGDIDCRQIEIMKACLELRKFF